MMQNKTISVAMCTYNGDKYLWEQLQSIASQTRFPHELVICDDRFTDSTTDIIRDFTGSAPFPVRLHINPANLGAAAKGITRNFEQASRLCTGDLIAFCDQDDVGTRRNSLAWPRQWKRILSWEGSLSMRSL